MTADLRRTIRAMVAELPDDAAALRNALLAAQTWAGTARAVNAHMPDPWPDWAARMRAAWDDGVAAPGA